MKELWEEVAVTGIGGQDLPRDLMHRVAAAPKVRKAGNRRKPFPPANVCLQSMSCVLVSKSSSEGQRHQRQLNQRQQHELPDQFPLLHSRSVQILVTMDGRRQKGQGEERGRVMVVLSEVFSVVLIYPTEKAAT